MRPARELFERGKELIHQGKYAEATEVFEVVVEHADTDVNAQNLLAVSRFNAGDVAGALTPAALAVYLWPSHATARTVLGLALEHVGRDGDALRQLARAARLGDDQARHALADRGKGHCGRCGGVTDAAGCARCAGTPPTTSSPRPRIWPWAHLDADDPRSALTLPGRTLDDIGAGYVDRYRQEGNADDVEDAILFLELAAATTDETERALPLTNLGTAYRVRFTCHGLPEDLDHAIDCHEQALAIARPGTWIEMKVLANLGPAYGSRHTLAGAGADLDRAVASLERALTFAEPDWDAYDTVLANAGGLYSQRFNRDHVRADIDRAIELQEQVVASTPAGHARFAGRLSNLAAALASRAERFPSLADLRRCAEFAEQAVRATRRGDPVRPTRLANLGSARLQLYQTTTRPDDLDAAITAAQHAYDAVPDGAPVLAETLSLLNDTYLALDSSGAPVDLDRAQVRAMSRRLATATASSVVDRVRAGRNLGIVASLVGDHLTAVELLDTTVAMLPAITSPEANWADRDRQYGRTESLVSPAVAAHCAVGDLLGAVRVAELGRGVQLAAQLDARGDLTELTRHLPEHARAFARVRTLLHERTGGSSESLAPLWQRYESLVEEIRRHPGFERFLRPPELRDLQRAAEAGTIVLVNAGRGRSDAILVGSTGPPRHVPLPDFTSNRILAVSEALLSVSGSPNQRDLLPATTHGHDILTDTLGWLWDTAVRPIRDALGPADSPRRVWWLPIGMVGVLPFHAAGHPGRPGALDAFVSSYTPTLRVLAQAHSRPPAPDRRQLVVAVARAPGLPTIPGTMAEAHDLVRRHPGLPPLTDDHATVDQVKSALRTATWAHFACHAGADYDVPSNSGLRLADGVLTVPEVSRLRREDAELAYLSACSTAHRSRQTIDESINLASAFHLAGFRHVVASLWPLNDDIAAAAARSFYRLAGDGVPLALRRVALELRARHPDRPDYWAALVHSGP